MAREYDPKIVDLILTLLANEDSTFGAVVGLSEAVRWLFGSFPAISGNLAGRAKASARLALSRMS